MVKTKKKVKKRKKSEEENKRNKNNNESLDTLCNVAGLSSSTALLSENDVLREFGDEKDEELSGCLAEFETLADDDDDDINVDGVAAKKSNSDRNDEEGDEEAILKREGDNNNNNNTFHHCKTKKDPKKALHNNNNNNKNTTNSIVTTPPSPAVKNPPPDLSKDVPDIRIELSRHYQMGQLSKFLLTKCPNLRMPSFERWLFDIKLEERSKRQRWISLGKKKIRGDEGKKRKKRKTKRRYDNDDDDGPPANLGYDPVIPTYPNVNDGASQRLLSEIIASQTPQESQPQQQQQQQQQQGFAKKKKEKHAFFILQQLCSKSIDAAKEVANLSSRIGRNPFLLQVHDDDFVSSFSKKKHKKNKKKKKLLGGNERIVLETSSTTTTTTTKGNDGGDDDNDDDATSTTTDTASDNNMYTLLYQRKITDLDIPNKNNKDSNTNTKSFKTIFLVKINKSHYEKLRNMFNSVHHRNDNNNDNTAAGSLYVPLPFSSTKKNMTKSSSPIVQTFHSILFCLILRYSSISGGYLIQDLKGGGMQGAIHSFVFTILDRYFNGEVGECFASPLNVNQEFYFSAFGGGGGKDGLDCHFGSRGDFFDIKVGSLGKTGHKKGGLTCLEANPPFVPGMMNEMVSKMEEHLDDADEHVKDLMFAIIIPTYHSDQDCSIDGEDQEGGITATQTVQKYASQSFIRMIRSKHFAHHIVLKSKEHGYIEGAQHLRPTKYKTSQYDTSLIVLTTRRMIKKGEIADAVINWETFEQDVRSAFASRHEDELKERRMSKKRKKVDLEEEDDDDDGE